MFKEWKAILKKPSFIIIMVGISLIPALYNVIFLSSMWDPYGKLSDLPVAVVNQDQPATFNAQTLMIGEDMVEQLQKNDSLDFQMVSAEEARKGLEKGDYYMIVTLPNDLSAKAASILTDQPEEMVIDYQTSSGHSFIASKMGDSAMVSLKQTVANNITNTYTTSLFDSMGNIKDGLEKAAAGSGRLAEGGKTLQAGNQTMESGLQTLAASTMTFSDGAHQLHTGLGTYTLGVQQLATGLDTLSGGMMAYTDGVTTLSSGVSRLAGGVMAYTQGVSELSAGTNQLSDGVTAYTQGVADLSAGLFPYLQGVGNLSGGLEQFSPNLSRYLQGVTAVANGANQLSATSTNLTAGANQLVVGLESLKTAVADAGIKPEQAQQLQALEVALGQIQASLSQPVSAPDGNGLEASLATIESQAGVIASSAHAERSAVLNSVTATSAYQHLSEEEQTELSAAVLGTSSQIEASAQAILDLTGSIRGQLTSLSSSGASLNVQEASSVIEQTRGAISGIVASTDQQVNLLAGLERATKGATSLSEGLTTYTQGVSSVADGAAQLVANHEQLAQGVNQLEIGAKTLVSNNDKLASGANQLVATNTTLNAGMGALQVGSATLVGKNTEVHSGLDQLVEGATQLTSKNGELLSGLGQLMTGTGLLNQNSAALLSGATQLSEGATQIAAGSGSLADGSQQLGTGLASLVTGAEQLQTGLDTADQTLSTVTTGKKNAAILANPLQTKKTDKDHVGKNGVGMAPYMISVALFVAAISTNMIFSTLPSGRVPKNRLEWFKSRLEVNGVIALIAGFLVYGAVHWIGLTANHEWATLWLILLASSTFMAVVTSLVTWNNRLGAFASLILLLLQLASSAGTYPLQLTDKVFQALNPWLPISYSVAGLRQTISMGGHIGGQVTVLCLMLCLAIGFGLAIYKPQSGEK
ncbi:YhgE/Pip family protein [Streptococcus himalayensis]|uniref:Membrane protein n=1 Tax=Streptococcus himalayensis TaxID=1888195 RepID=A0A917A2I5_9STRE|nr:YhgE/Pip domain-containing protein [Streptococcus himalayensis]GGE23592.1 membrane protein [Streptococcus himalayensis]